jgi:hypothetical protein
VSFSIVNTRARNGYFAESASDQPNTRARNGYFAESRSDQPITRARNGYFAESGSDQPNTRVENSAKPQQVIFLLNFHLKNRTMCTILNNTVEKR